MPVEAGRADVRLDEVVPLQGVVSQVEDTINAAQVARCGDFDVFELGRGLEAVLVVVVALCES